MELQKCLVLQLLTNLRYFYFSQIPTVLYFYIAFFSLQLFVAESNWPIRFRFTSTINLQKKLNKNDGKPSMNQSLVLIQFLYAFFCTADSENSGGREQTQSNRQMD